MHSYDKNFPPQYFIDFFSAIPAHMFTVGSYHDKSTDRCCTVGFLMDKQEGYAITPAIIGLNKVIAPLRLTVMGTENYASGVILPFTKSDPKEHGKILVINDGSCIEYTAATPKGRILAALYDAKAWWDAYEGDLAVEQVKNHLATTPVRHRTMAGIFAFVVIILSLFLASGCTAYKQSGGCHATRGKVGY